MQMHGLLMAFVDVAIIFQFLATRASNQGQGQYENQGQFYQQ